MNISLPAFVPENLVSRGGFGSPVPRQPAHLHTQAESGAYLYDAANILHDFDGGHLNWNKASPLLRPGPSFVSFVLSGLKTGNLLL